MPEYLSPGVYIEEIEMGPKPIEGVSTSTAGFLGETERGPTKPKLVTSWNQYQRIFGSYFGKDKYLPYAVQGFFANGGKRCYIARIEKSKEKASFDVKIDFDSFNNEKTNFNSLNNLKIDSHSFKVEAVGEGDWGKDINMYFSKPTVNEFKLSIYYKKNPESDTPVKINPKIDTPVEIFDNLSLDENNPDFYKKRINGISDFICLSSESDASNSEVNTPNSEEDTKDSEKDKDASKESKPEKPKNTSGTPDYTLENDVLIKVPNELFTGQPLKYESTNLEPLVVGDFIGKDSEKPNLKGLRALSEIDGISILYSPDVSKVNGLAGELVTKCEELKDRFVIIDNEQSSNTFELDIKSEKGYAAFYHPWVKVIDPQDGVLTKVPPGGHIAGVYARSDIERGVFKAPANEILRGVSDLVLNVTTGEQDVLNPKGINAIRSLPGRGIRVWGARTLATDPLWKYVNVRRLFIFLEKSIEQNTQWVVFEPNNERLWDRVIQTISQFLTQVWKDGALMGNTPEEGFFVKCDRTTMTQNDIDNGRLIVMIGVAPTKPAEFVIFRIAQWTAGAS